MSLKEDIHRFKKALSNHLNGKTPSSESQLAYIEMAVSEVPKIKETRGKDHVSFGDDNLWPQRVSDLKYGSAIHNAILETAADMIAGDGYLIDGAKTKEESEAKYNSLPADIKSEYDRFLKNEHDDSTVEQINSRLAFDLKELGAYAFEAVYNNEKTKIVRKKYVDVRNIRAGKMVNDRVESYWYSRDWSQTNNKEYKPNEISAFNTKKINSLNQLYYCKRGPLEYYGQPDWIGCLTWVQTDFQMGIFHLANIENGMNPSIKLQFYKLPTNETEKQQILDDIRRTFVGAKKTGKHMVFFSDGKDLAPLVEPIATNNLDKQLLLLAELCDKKILTGHKLTSPLLAGISVSGQIGGNTELEKAFKIYAKTRIYPMSKMISDADEKILAFNNASIKLRTNPYDPFNG